MLLCDLHWSPEKVWGTTVGVLLVPHARCRDGVYSFSSVAFPLFMNRGTCWPNVSLSVFCLPPLCPRDADVPAARVCVHRPRVLNAWCCGLDLEWQHLSLGCQFSAEQVRLDRPGLWAGWESPPFWKGLGGVGRNWQGSGQLQRICASPPAKIWWRLHRLIDVGGRRQNYN